MRKYFLAAGWIVLAAAVVAVYVPGLHGSFVFDDGPNLVQNDAVQITDLSIRSLMRAARSGIATDFGRPVSMLSFGINFATTGIDPFYFKLTNLLIHLINVGLVGGLCYLLVAHYPCFSAVQTRARGIALATAALWGLHPFQVSTTLYVVQRMAQLAALFTLVGLLLYTVGRIRQWRGQRGAVHILIGLLVFGPLAFLSKETGVLLIAYVVVLELFGSQPRPPERAQIPTPALVGVMACGAAAAALYLWLRIPSYASVYWIKGFSAMDRVLTEPRALVWYVKAMIFPDIREMGLTHDDWEASRSLWTPWSTAPALAVVLVSIGALPWLRALMPAAGLCLAWFLAGHSLEASPLPLDLVYEHRNYLPSVGILLGIVAAGGWILGRTIPSVARSATISACAIATVLASVTMIRVNEWRDPLSWGLAQTQHHPKSAISFLDLGAAYATLAEGATDPTARETFYERADAAFAEASRLRPRSASAPAARVILEFRMGHAAPQALLDEVARNIGVGAMGAGSRLAVVQILACASKDPRCKLESVQFMAIVNAALGNPACPPFYCSQVLALASEFYGERQKDVEAAIMLAKAATEVPGAAEEVWLPLVRWLIVGGYLKQAGEALDQLDRVDKLDSLGERRTKLRRDLEARLRQAGK